MSTSLDADAKRKERRDKKEPDYGGSAGSLTFRGGIDISQVPDGRLERRGIDSSSSTYKNISFWIIASDRDHEIPLHLYAPPGI